MSPLVLRVVVLLVALTHPMLAQLSESFDAVFPPDLPPGWSSTQERTASDFVTTTSLAASQPNCVLATNATIEQSLTTASVDLRDLLVHALTFQTRRSSTFRAGVLVEASTDGGVSFPVRLGDTLWAGQSTGSYERHRLSVPPHAGDTLRFRWRVVADRSGTGGTLRIDDVALEADPIHDLEARALEFVPALPGEPLLARVLIANSGLLEVPSCEVRLGIDGDGDSLFAPHECVARGTVAPAPGESLELVIEVGRAPPGLTRAVAEVRSVLDRHTANDAVYALFRAGVPRGEVVFNEIMYAPLTGEAEYIELFVRAPEQEGLGGWELTVGGSDPATMSTVVFPDSPEVGGRFVLIASRRPEPELLGEGSIGLLVSSHLLLRNEGGLLLLRDPSGMMADSLQYDPSWHTPSVVETRGRSLEKLLPELPSADGRNWATCVEPAGGTPGRPNSVSVRAVGNRALLACSPNPFSPDGDGVDDWTILRYDFPGMVQTVDVTIYDGRGRTVRHLATRELGGVSGTLVWDGRDDASEAVRMGIYVAVIRGLDAQGGDLLTAKTAVVVARALR